MAHYIAPLYTLGVRAQADRAERARALGREADAAAAAAEATTLMRRFEELLERDPSSDARNEYLQAQAEMSRVRGGGDAEPWRAAAAQWRATARPYRAAYADWRTAEAIVRSGGASDEATRLLQDAASVARELGAQPLLNEITKLARRARLDLASGDEDATGSPRRRDDDLGLTDRERDVLLLLAEGRTNRQIGERLFISEKTASVHVSRILAKLGVANRAEAAGIAHTLGLQPVGADAGNGADAQRSETQ
jgi:DNA-binding CsgD family transcriptional regulator